MCTPPRGRGRTPPCSSRICPSWEIAQSGESPRGRRGGKGIAPDPIPFIDLSDEEKEEEEEDVMDTGMDWTMAWKEEVTEVLDPGMA